MWPFQREPYGYTLIRSDGTLVVVQDGRYFVRTGRKDDSGSLVYQDGYKTYEYSSW